MDGYDKLKPYGFCVHGAIDGYVFWWLIKSSFHREGHKSKGLKIKKKENSLIKTANSFNLLYFLPLILLLYF